MNAKLDSFGYPTIQCRTPTHNLKANCIGKAEPQKVQRDEDGNATVVRYRCEHGHGFSVPANILRNLENERVLEVE